MEVPANVSSTYVTIQNNVVAPGGFIGFEFLSREDSITSPPVFLTVKNNVFNNSYIYIYDALPENSSITVQDNIMFADRTTRNPFITCIQMTYFYLMKNATLFINDNVMNVSSQTGGAVRALYFASDTEIGESSSVAIFRNKLVANGNIDGSLFYIDDAYLEAVNSSLVVTSNSFTATSTDSIDAFHTEYVFSDYDVLYTGQTGYFSFSNNFVNVTSGDASGRAIYFNDPYYLHFYIDNNQIYYNVGTAVRMDYSDLFNAFSISGNTFQYTNASSITSDVILVDYFYIFYNSSYVVSNNKVIASSVTTMDAKLISAGSLYFNDGYVNNSTLIASCGNTLPWAASPTLDQLFSSAIVDYTVELCGSVTTSSPSFAHPRHVVVGIVYSILTIFIFIL
eukprot:GILI01009116.1.p1 GENE.GILI01009116.1~~GILI01009116.1.p1  ORF type:complete len:442 (+),score=72.90 GILI01009116.1:143-1327(+)